MYIEKKRTVNSGALKSSMLVKIPEWGLNMWVNHFKNDQGKQWFGYPSLPYTTAQGEKKYHWLAYFDPPAREKFEEKLRSLLKETLNDEEDQEPLPF